MYVEIWLDHDGITVSRIFYRWPTADKNFAHQQKFDFIQINRGFVIYKGRRNIFEWVGGIFWVFIAKIFHEIPSHMLHNSIIIALKAFWPHDKSLAVLGITFQEEENRVLSVSHTTNSLAKWLHLDLFYAHILPLELKKLGKRILNFVKNSINIIWLFANLKVTQHFAF